MRRRRVTVSGKAGATKVYKSLYSWLWLVPGVLIASAILFTLFAGTSKAQEEGSGGLTLDAPQVVLDGIPFSVDIEAAGAPPDSNTEIVVAGESYEASFSEGTATVEDIVVDQTGDVPIALAAGGEQVAEQTANAIPGWLSILPPLLAIGIALAFRQVVAALFLGIYLGAVLVYGPSLAGLWYGLLDTLQVYVIEAIAPPDGSTGHASIIVFTLMIGGMVGIISRNGGTRGIVNKIVPYASNPRRGQTATGALGIAIFFDDYANTLVVGNTMRPITDRLRISREKLAYIVDSTAAPVATIALVTTWIGFQVGLIGDAVDGIEGFSQSAYSIFLNSIPYAFYPILAILFVFAVAITGRDFGPMYKAERRARDEGQVLREGADVDPSAGKDDMEADEDVPARALNAIVPIVVLVGVALGGLLVTGEGSSIREIIGSADPFATLVWGSLLSVIVAVALSVGQRILTLGESMAAWYSGLRAMLFVLVILVLAWALSGVTDVLHTGDYLVSVLGESVPPAIIPALIFLVAAATAFSTGTSWGTMGILIPLVVPLTWAVLQANGMATEDNYYIMYASVSTVLAGAVWGDHCSPISDTTIISSMASNCDHIDHVRTQLPYALFTGGIALVLGLIPVGFGVPWWIAMPVSAAAAIAGLLFLGKKVTEPAREQAAEKSATVEQV